MAEINNNNNNNNNNIDFDKNEYLNKPMNVVDKLFELNQDNLNNGTVYKNFENIISEDQIYKSIPLVSTINQCDLNNGKLVKIRCMIQDIFDPQFCPTFNKIKNIKTNKIRLEASKYKDRINLSDDEELIFDSFDSSPFDKLTLYCIPIPCENKWVDKNNNDSLPQPSLSSNKKKRNMDDADMKNENDDEDIKKPKDEITTTTEDSKKSTINNNKKNNGTTTTKTTTSKIDINKIFNYPIPIDSNDENNIKTPFIVNIYDDDVVLDENGKPLTFKINEIIEFIGVVAQFDPTLQQQSFSSSNQVDDETPIIDLMSMLDVDEISTIPDTLIPQFHVITYRYLDPYKLNHLNPFSKISTTVTSINDNNLIIREELIKFINRFIVDELLSEYLLFHLISKVYSFTSGLCIGNFSMNISIPNDEEFQRLPELIERLYEILLPRSYRFSMTLENLNDMDVVPYKDYDRNRIVSGLLQLPKSSNLILDETLLTEGKVEPQGIKALNALNTLSIQQKVEYDFKFHPIEIQTDIPTISISFGKSLIKGETQISINKSIKLPTINEISQQLKQDYSDNDKLDQFRNYINHCKNLTFKISSSNDSADNHHNDDATHFIQEDFVKSRQLDPKMTTDVFHYWLTLSRLIALSYKDQYIKIDKWDMMKSLEEKRKLTIN